MPVLDDDDPTGGDAKTEGVAAVVAPLPKSVLGSRP